MNSLSGLNEIESFLLFVALPTVLACSLLEAVVLWRRQGYDWKALGVSLFDLAGRTACVGSGATIRCTIRRTR